MSIRFRLLTEPDVKAVLTMDDLIETMTSALRRFSSGLVVQPVRPTIPIADDAFFATMPAYVRGTNSNGVRRGSDPHPEPRLTPETAALGAKLVTVFGGNAAKGLHSHLASILLMDPDTGALLALLDGRYITEARTAAVSAVSSRLLARTASRSVAIIGTGVQARSHLDALSGPPAESGDRLEPEQRAPRALRRRRDHITTRSRSGCDGVGIRSRRGYDGVG